MSDHINPLDYKIPAPDTAYFKDIHTMALVSYFPRSGSSLLGYLLTAHPNMVLANEPARKEEKLYGKVPFIVLLNYILYMDRVRYEDAEQIRSLRTLEEALGSNNAVKRFYDQQERYIFVPNQWQARCESLEVIGVKNSLPLAESLSVEEVLQKLKKNLKKFRIRRLRFIFTVRNPYDMIATDVVYWARNKRLRVVTQDDVNKMLDYKIKVSFPMMCRRGKKLFKLMKPKITPDKAESISDEAKEGIPNRAAQSIPNQAAQSIPNQAAQSIPNQAAQSIPNQAAQSIPNQATDILISKHEDLVASSARQLTKLCRFLKLSCPPDYLKDCASVVRSKTNKSRHELHWSDEQKEEVRKIIDKYDFFSGYDWDT